MPVFSIFLENHKVSDQTIFSGNDRLIKGYNHAEFQGKKNLTVPTLTVGMIQFVQGGGVYKVPMVVAYKVPIVVAYKVLNSISKKRSPRFGSRKVCL